MEFRNAYEREPHEGIVFPEKVLAQQQYKEECDINTIIDRYTKAGVVPSDLLDAAEGVYGDFSDVGDYLDMQNALLKARESFDALPSAVRDRFNHDPAQLIDFINNDKNYDEAVKLGLVNARPEKPSQAEENKE